MPLVGPKRLVLLNAGKYDFADVDLDEPLHLVGPNNVGKTSLIAALQFLYIDSQNQMHFARDMRETRKYYFPDSYSYILFECLTPGGFRVLGIHGTGPLHQYDFERFTYVGRLDLADFLDGVAGDTLTCRAWDDVKLRLAHREFLPLEAKDLRAALTGAAAKDGGVSLGLLPLAQRTSYERFSRVFRNLLRLSHVTQHELKQLLVDIFEREFRQRELNLDGDYREQYEGVRRGWRDVALLQHLTGEIDELLTTVETRTRLRSTLPARWRTIHRVASQERERSLSEESQINEEMEGLEASKQALESELEAFTKKTKDLAAERGGLETKVQDVTDKRAEFVQFTRELVEAQAGTLGHRVAELEAKLASVATHDVQHLLRMRRERSTAADKLASQVTATQLAGEVLALHMERSEIESAFSLLDADLLGLPVSSDPDEGVSMRPKILAEQLRMLAGCFNTTGYVGEAADVRWKWLERPTVTELVDRGEIGRRLSDVRAEIEGLDQDIETDERREEFENEKTRLRRDLEELREKLWRHDEVARLAAQEPVWRERIAAIEAQEADLVQAQKALFSRQGELEVALSDRKKWLHELRQGREGLTHRLQRMDPPEPDWPAIDEDNLGDNLDLLVDEYVRDSKEQRRLQARVAELFSLIDRSTDGRYPSGDESEAIRLLGEDRAAFPQREKALQQLWASLLTGLRSGLTALHRDIETLRTRIDALNRQLTRHGVSDLEQVYLDIQDTAELRLVRSVAAHEEAPLLADRKSAERALERIGDLLKEHPRIGLMSLFDLHFVVTTPGGVTKKYADLDKVESNGTTVTIKVLVNLLLLRGLISEREAGHVNIPFYLDEVASLDARNRGAVIALARELGFVPVLASPEPLEGADRVYFVSDNAGRITLDPKGSRIRLLRGQG